MILLSTFLSIKRNKKFVGIVINVYVVFPDSRSLSGIKGHNLHISVKGTLFIIPQYIIFTPQALVSHTFT